MHNRTRRVLAATLAGAVIAVTPVVALASPLTNNSHQQTEAGRRW